MQTIDREYVLYQRKDKGATDHNYIYDYCTVDAGSSDIASLTYRTGEGEVGTIHFGMDGDYRARLIAGDTEVPQHYQEGKILDTAAPWMWLYDDEGKVCDLVNQYGFEVYRSGVMGLLIRFKLKGGEEVCDK